jgi:hypothetical protein
VVLAMLAGAGAAVQSVDIGSPPGRLFDIGGTRFRMIRIHKTLR